MENAIQIIKTLENAGYTAYIAGGAVRDMLMGKTPNDYDIATSAKPEVVCSLFPRCIKTGIRHGTVTVLMNSAAYEVTTYRTESGYTDNRRPDSVVFVTDINDDLMRRDFTVNAMAYHYEKGIIDPFCGREDIKARIMRCVGNPAERFSEDALRMLRCVRFASVLNFKIDPDTFNAIIKLSGSIKNISAERIKQELDKLLTADNASIAELYSSGLLKQILPEIVIKSPAQAKIIEDRVKSVSKSVAARWAAFLWDVADDAPIITNRLKFSNALKREVLGVLKYKLNSVPVTKKDVKQLLNKTELAFYTWLELKKAEKRENEQIISDQMLSDRTVSLAKNLAQDIEKNGEPYLIRHLKVSGSDVLNAGFKPQDVKKVLEMLLDAVMDNPQKNSFPELTKMMQEYKNLKDKEQ